MQTTTHPLCTLLRELRAAARMSLKEFERKFGIPAVVMAAYERGDRVPPLTKIDHIFGCFGYKIIAVPIGHRAVRLPGDIIADLRALADQLDGHV